MALDTTTGTVIPLNLDSISTDTHTITPDAAGMILSQCGYQNQRPVSQGTVKKYANFMRTGKWLTSTITLSRTPGGYFLINGQHRLRAVIESGIPQGFIIEVLDSTGETETSRQYAVIDEQRRRSAVDNLWSYPEIRDLGLTKSDIKIIIACAEVIADGFETSKGPDATYKMQMSLIERKGQFLKDWREESAELLNAIGTGSARGVYGRVRQVSVFSVALVTVRYQRDKALPFWASIAQSDRLVKGTGAHALHQYLAEIRSQDHIRTPRVAAAAWNAYYRERDVIQLRPSVNLIRMSIDGTPYKPDTSVRYDYRGGTGVLVTKKDQRASNP